MCYDSGSAKAVCDAIFLGDMESDVTDYVENKNKYLKKVMKSLLRSAADVFYKAVSTIEAARDAFCAATPNPGNSPECQTQDAGIPDGSTEIGDVSRTGEGSSVTYTLTCELWRFPNGDGGYYYLDRNCVVTSIER